jgi:hypothetical protein
VGSCAEPLFEPFLKGLAARAGRFQDAAERLIRSTRADTNDTRPAHLRSALMYEQAALTFLQARPSPPAVPPTAPSTVTHPPPGVSKPVWPNLPRRQSMDPRVREHAVSLARTLCAGHSRRARAEVRSASRACRLSLPQGTPLIPQMHKERGGDRGGSSFQNQLE